MSAQKVDVLAVIDDLISDLDYSDPHERIDVVREARAAVAELIKALNRIERRAKYHSDDNDADRKRNLYHIECMAREARARIGSAS